MRKLLNKPWFVVLLALTAIVSIGWEYLLPTAAPAGGAAAAPELSEPAAADSEAPQRLSLEAALKAIHVKGEVRDPFAVPAKSAAEPTEGRGDAPERFEQLHLSACWVQGSTTWLLLNGRIYRPGDTIGRGLIESAAIEGAWIVCDGARQFLAVGQDLALRAIGPGPKTTSP